MMQSAFNDAAQIYLTINRQFLQNATGDISAALDPVRATRSFYYPWGGAHPAHTIFTVATQFPSTTTLPIYCVRIVAIQLYAAAATTFSFTDNSVANYVTRYVSAQGNQDISKSQLGDGGLQVFTDFTVTPSANSGEIFIVVIPEYTVPE